MADGPIAVLARNFQILGKNTQFSALKGRIWDEDVFGRLSFNRAEVQRFFTARLDAAPPESFVASIQGGKGNDSYLLTVQASTDPDLKDYVFLKITPQKKRVLNRRAVMDTYGLSHTEVEILLQLLAKNTTIAGIARTRGVSENTIKTQVRSIFQKAGVSDKAELTVEILSSPQLTEEVSAFDT